MSRKEKRNKQLLHEKYKRAIALSKEETTKPVVRQMEKFPSFARCSRIYSSVFSKY